MNQNHRLFSESVVQYKNTRKWISSLVLFYMLLSTIAIKTSHAQLITIGPERQLFFGGGLVETETNTRLRLNQARKEESNPIIWADKPWETKFKNPEFRIAWVIFDEALQKFRLRYTVGAAYKASGRDETGRVLLDKNTIPGYICEAFSEDGIHWEKPNLGFVEFEGSKENNILAPGMYKGYFFQDLHDPDQNKRYKTHVRTGDMDISGMTFSYYYSADAYTWTAYENNPVIDQGDQIGRWGPTDFMGWDSIRKVYAVHMENNHHMNSKGWHRRSIGRSESPDMLLWSTPETIIRVDDRDYPDTEFYAMPTIIYENTYIGFLWNFSTTNTMIYPTLAFSCDGITYNRDMRDPIISLGDAGAFDEVAVYANQPIVHNDEIFCFYTGTNWRSLEQLLELGDKSKVGIGLAKFPLDGFVSYEGVRGEDGPYSVITTRSFAFLGKNLYLNFFAASQHWGAAPCEVKVELLDSRHTPIEGFTFEDADLFSKTNINQLISWKSSSDVSSLEGTPIRLKIWFKNAKLYSFKFR